MSLELDKLVFLTACKNGAAFQDGDQEIYKHFPRGTIWNGIVCAIAAGNFETCQYLYNWMMEQSFFCLDSFEDTENGLDWCMSQCCKQVDLDNRLLVEWVFRNVWLPNTFAFDNTNKFCVYFSICMNHNNIWFAKLLLGEMSKRFCKKTIIALLMDAVSVGGPLKKIQIMKLLMEQYGFLLVSQYNGINDKYIKCMQEWKTYRETPKLPDCLQTLLLTI